MGGHELGYQVIPRVGMEALIAYQERNPDRPFVTALVPGQTTGLLGEALQLAGAAGGSGGGAGLMSALAGLAGMAGGAGGGGLVGMAMGAVGASGGGMGGILGPVAPKLGSSSLGQLSGAWARARLNGGFLERHVGLWARPQGPSLLESFLIK